MRDIRICGVVMNSKIYELLPMISQAEKESGLIEIRIDYLLQHNELDLFLIKKKMKKEIIIICRRADEGGRWTTSESNRLLQLQKAYDLEFNYVDIELKTLQEKRFKIPRRTLTKTIVSFHDFKRTPSIHDLKETVLKMKQYNPYIMKIATMIKHKEDASLLYKLLLERKKGDKYIIIGMGDKGVLTRITTPLLGGYMTYCSIHNNGSAPGQISCKKMKEFYSLIS